LGLPLKVVDRFTSKEKVIGVLKVEEIVPSESHSERFFTDQDVLLVTMMANIIATVVYNTQVSSVQLQKLSSNLEELSIALAGGREMRDLVDQIVKTMARVLGAEASSLYLIDEATNELVIQTPPGYQQIHVGAGARYSLGEGITGWIAAKGELFRANSLQELFNHPAWKGKHPNEDRREPNSFLGLPLKVVDRFTSKEKVIGVLKVEEIVPSESHPERFFTDQDVLLVTMMANIIATVIYNTRRGEARVGDILKRMGTLSDPVNASLDLLHTSACSADWGVIDQLAMAIASILDKKPDKAETEAKALFDARANPLLYNRIANWAQHEDVQWKFHFFDCVLKIGAESGSWDHLMDIARPWLALRGDVNDPQYFAEAANHLARKIAEAIRVEPIDRGTDPSAIWFGTVLDTARIFGDPIDRILLLVQRRGELDEDNLSRMHIFAEKGLKRPYQVLMFVPLMFSFASAHVERMKQRMRIHAMDVVVANIPEILHILEAARPEEAFRGLVLRQITTTSPFVMVGPVPDGMFFGRERELRAIIQYVGVGRSCVIIAGRRIGKTSVLSRLHRVRLPEVGFRTLYHDCSNTKSYDAFLATTIRNWRPEPPSSIAMTLGGLIENPPADKPVVLLLDEADKLVPFDRGNNWQLFNKLRDLINSGRAQVVLSGESTLREALRDPTSPLFNLVNEMRLGPLEPRDVRELVTRPLKQLEIQLVDEAAIVDRVYDFTSGHPNVVQRLCHRLVGRINERGTHRIALDDLNEVIRDPDFQRTDFLGTYWEAATCLEKIVSLLMADDVSIRTLKTVRHILAERCNLYPDAREVDDALQRLVDLRSILKRVSAGYDFAVKAFPHVVAGTMTLDDMLEILVEEYREMPNGS
jgi:GAF domain-containing protein